MYQSIFPFINILAACYFLARWCAQFDQASSFLCRRMPAGVKGATVSAIGSSMPELMSAFVLLFWYNDAEAFAIALGITAGSGVFNTAVIPALAILFARDEQGNPVDKIELDGKFLRRDVIWVVVTDLALVGLIIYGYISLWAALALNCLYFGWAYHTYLQAKSSGQNEVETYEEEPLPNFGGSVRNFINGNARTALFGSAYMTTNKAITLLVLAIVVITLFSHILVEGVVGAADILNIPPFISGLILGAAASSLPDTLLSVQDSRKGGFKDAIANPLASNTFDTSISIGLPLVLWLLWNGMDGIEVVGENMEALRISVVAMSASIGSLLLFKHKKVTRATAWTILTVYAAWATWIGATYV